MIRAYDDNGNVVDLVAWQKQIRADAIDEVLQIVHNVYAHNFYCIEDTCPNGKEDCDDCLYVAINKNLEQLKEHEDE